MTGYYQISRHIILTGCDDYDMVIQENVPNFWKYILKYLSANVTMTVKN